MKKFFLILLILYSAQAMSQFIVKETLNKRLSAGFINNFYFYENVFDEGDKARMILYEIIPEITYFVKNTALGASFGYKYAYINFYKNESFMQIGLFIRYYVPLKIDRKFLKRIKLYGETGLYKTNYVYKEKPVEQIYYKDITLGINHVKSNGMNQNLLIFPVGIQFQLYKDLYCDFKWGYYKFIEGDGMIESKIGLIYFFEKK